MKKTLLLCALAGIALAQSGCINAPEYPIEPILSFKSMTKNRMIQNGQENTTITIEFTDGDGDIGINATDSITWTTPNNELRGDRGVNLFVIDPRTNYIGGTTYRIPYIPSQGISKAVTGDIDIDMASGCCIYSATQACTPNPAVPTNEVRYLVVAVDKAGHRSNVLELPAITLLCQ